MTTHAWVHQATFKIQLARLSLTQSILGKLRNPDHQQAGFLSSHWLQGEAWQCLI